jgi:hypothetical protein
MNFIIIFSRTSYIKAQLIITNIAWAHEIFLHIKTTKIKVVIFKINLKTKVFIKKNV